MKKMIKYIFFLILSTKSAIAGPFLLDRVIVIVNNDIILASDVNNMLKIIKCGFQKVSHQFPDETQLRRQIINQLIMDQILLQKVAYTTDSTISDEQIDQTILNIAAQHHMTLKQLHNHLIAKDINYKTYRLQIHKELLITKICNDKVSSRITILPQEVDSLTKKIATKTDGDTEFNLSHILIPLTETPSQSEIEKAKLQVYSLMSQYENGEDFGKLAMTYSADTQALQGGDMGWNKLEELPSLFVTHLHDAKKGSLIGPIRSGIGFHILKVNDIYGGKNKIIIKEVRARHILLRPSILITDHQIFSQLKDIAQKIKKGYISFSDVAKQLSEDLNSSNLGGDLGWHSLDEFDSDLRNILIKLKKFEISVPVQASDGWHLIQLIDIREVDHTANMQRNLVYQLLFNRKFKEETQIWMQEQLASAYVKILDNSDE